VILVTISTIRADHVGSLGYHRKTTPNFDSFARSGILFKNAFAISSWMMPAHGSIFTSLYPDRHQATHIKKSLDEKCKTLAEILSDNRFYCAGFCCNPRLSSEKGFAQGFDLYDDYSASIILKTLAFSNSQFIDINRTRTNNLINDAAIRWLQNNTHQPFFLFVHYYDNHWDYLPEPPYDAMFETNYQGMIDGTGIAREPLYSNPPERRDIEHIIALYDGQLRQTDEDLAELLKFLKNKDLFENSIIIVMGDHGEQFYEHGNTSHHGLFDELIHIPLIISIPGLSDDGKVVDALVSQLDILPTILDYLKIPVPGHCQGVSLRPLIEGARSSVNEFIFAEYTGGAVPDSYVIRDRRYKLYLRQDSLFAFDLLDDPAEQHKIRPSNFPQYVQMLVKNLQKMKSDPKTENPH